MATSFQFYRILCTTPPDLEEERLAFESAVAQFVEQVSMPDRVLFAPASLRPPIVAAVQKSAIERNIRECEFFLQIFGEERPDPVFPGFVEYALACAADAAMVTRAAAVLFRNHARASEEVRAFRESLASRGGCELRDFRNTEELGGVVRELLREWYAALGTAR